MLRNLFVFALLMFLIGMVKIEHSFGEEKSINVLISELGSKNKNIVRGAKEELKVLGDEALDSLRKSAATENRKLRLEIISTYGEIILGQQKNPQDDKFIMNSLSDEYYMVRIVILGILARSGKTDIVGKASQKLKEPAEDDGKIFADIIDEMRKKVDGESKVMSPTMLEESYLTTMGKKINPKIEAMIFNENEQSNLRMKLIFIYCQINGKEGNSALIEILGKTSLAEIKETALAGLRNPVNQNDVPLISDLRALLSKEKNFEIKQMYKSVIGYLSDSTKEN